jgi:hypothetical protein
MPNRITTDRYFDLETDPKSAGTGTGVRNIWPDVPIGRGSGGKSDICLRLLNKLGAVICADVTIEVEYKLVGQPDASKLKSFRYVIHKDDGAWSTQPVDFAGSFCER